MQSGGQAEAAFDIFLHDNVVHVHNTRATKSPREVAHPALYSSSFLKTMLVVTASTISNVE